MAKSKAEESVTTEEALEEVSESAPAPAAEEEVLEEEEVIYDPDFRDPSLVYLKWQGSSDVFCNSGVRFNKGEFTGVSPELAAKLLEIHQLQRYLIKE